MGDKCYFNGCSNECADGAWKCEFHKNRVRCRFDDCRNQVYARYLCVRHGGKKKCQYPNCVGNARVGAYCCRHGAASKKKHCIVDGCTKVAHARRLCVAHGGGRLCKIEGCTAHARHAGCCRKHGREGHEVMPTVDDMVKEEPMETVMTSFMHPKKTVDTWNQTDLQLPIDVLEYDFGHDVAAVDVLLDVSLFDCQWYGMFD
ncbi:Aste57867_24697 [Aphanomyces stellatus]|uniref:Aste57867_24697 protein n=1 Tax=Aphanomyces stellatus TaxID=120398 RepID=A0A485LS49_9STRA|nr:hypothetical protein As57867_024619 [Aphanomyces stellatus]VFU01334.1 Aste57867_24697 [Aphanomyces stellatus]